MELTTSTPERTILGNPTGELALRVLGSRHAGKIVRLHASKCTIGMDRTCTLRLQARGVADVHCFIMRGAGETVIRKCSPQTWLNGAPFEDAALRIGDRLSCGPIHFEVVALRGEAVNETPPVENPAVGAAIPAAHIPVAQPMSAAEKKLGSAKERIVQLVGRLERLELKLARGRKSARKSQRLIAKLKEQVSQTESQLESLRADHQQQTDALTVEQQSALAALREQLAARTVEHQTLQEEFAAANRHAEESLAELDRELTDLQARHATELQQEVEERDALVAKLAALQEKVDAQTETLESQSERAEAAARELVTVQSALADKTAEASLLEEQLAAEAEQAKTQLAELQAEFDAQTAALQTETERSQALTGELASIQSALADKTAEVSLLEEQLAAGQKETKTQLVELQAEFDAQSTALQTETERSQTFSAELACIQSALADKTATITDLQAELSTALAEAAAQQAATASETHSLEQRLAAKELEWAELTAKFDLETRQLQASREADRSPLAESATTAQQQLLLLQSECDALRTASANTDAELKSQTVQYQSAQQKIAELEAACAQLDETNRTIQAKLDTQVAQLAEAQRNYETARLAEREKLDQLAAQLQASQAGVGEKSAQLATDRQALQQLEAQLADSTAQLERRATQIAELQNTLQRSHAEHEAELQQHDRAQSDELQRRESELNHSRAELEHERAELQLRQTEFATRLDEVLRRESDLEARTLELNRIQTECSIIKSAAEASVEPAATLPPADGAWAESGSSADYVPTPSQEPVLADEEPARPADFDPNDPFARLRSLSILREEASSPATPNAEMPSESPEPALSGLSTARFMPTQDAERSEGDSASDGTSADLSSSPSPLPRESAPVNVSLSEDADADVQDYMAQLLTRLRGGQPAPATASPTVEPQKPTTPQPEELVATAPVEELKPLKELVARATAPESDLGKLREIANSQARTVIHLHRKKVVEQSADTSRVTAIFCALFGAVAMLLGTSDLLSATGAVALLIASYWLIRARRLTRTVNFTTERQEVQPK